LALVGSNFLGNSWVKPGAVNGRSRGNGAVHPALSATSVALCLFQPVCHPPLAVSRAASCTSWVKSGW